MDEDTKIVLKAWRELVVENQRLKNELMEISHGSNIQRSPDLFAAGHWFFPSRRGRGGPPDNLGGGER